VDDHRLILAGIRRALERSPDIEVVGEADSGNQVLPLVARTSPDLVLLDLRLPDLDGLACLEALGEQFSDVKVVMLSAFADPEYVQAALSRGARGYIVKNVNPVDLASALRQALEGTVYHALGVPETDTRGRAQSAGLTERERVVLEAAARGLSNRAIARELWVTEQTVKFHLTNIFRKLGARNRTDAARRAYARGLLDEPLAR
jgi:DNA-binding NarL/FixJ family response regulator